MSYRPMKPSVIDRFSPPKEIREQTKERRAWIEKKIEEVTLAGQHVDVKSVGQGSYQHVSAKKASAVKPKTLTWVGLCQVCGRQHGSINGQGHVVAHHGYERPGDGWQTASCAGAMYPFLEQSCERAKEIASRLKVDASQIEAWASKPDAVKSVTITVRDPKRLGGTKTVEVTPDNAAQYDKRTPWERSQGQPISWLYFRDRDVIQQLTRAAQMQTCANELDARVRQWEKGAFKGTTRQEML